jgi:hypothetical protein
MRLRALVELVEPEQLVKTESRRGLRFSSMQNFRYPGRIHHVIEQRQCQIPEGHGQRVCAITDGPSPGRGRSAGRVGRP